MSRRPRQTAEADTRRLSRFRTLGPRPLNEIPLTADNAANPRSIVDCGWGRLLFAQTFEDPTELAEAMRSERADQRDIALYVNDPHVALAAAPQELFLDPSHIFRLDLSLYRASRRRFHGFIVRRLTSEADANEINRIYVARGMVPVAPHFLWSKRDSRAITVFVAEELETGAIIGTVTGVDHVKAFNDPNGGSSLWCLAVDPQAGPSGVGEALVRRIAEHFMGRGASLLDLSVLHDNELAIKLYEQLGFRRVALYALKRKNSINEQLFTGSGGDFTELNSYARLIVDEACRRGIQVEVTDAERGFFRLVHGGRSVQCRESLSDLTSAVAMSICDDKAVTRRIVEAAGIAVPDQIEATDGALPAFLEKHGSVVVKPASGEQGRGVAVGLSTLDEIEKAVSAARRFSDRVIVEEMVTGKDLRLVVINFQLVAAAVRRPPAVLGDGASTVHELIERQSRRREAATGSESRIPVDEETRRCLGKSGFALDDIPEDGVRLQVRNSANLHTGGTIHDVTDIVHPRLVDAACRCARAIDIPVVGIDLIVPSPAGPEYSFIEANERPGLANHEPQPTAERFVDLLFPLSIPQAVRLSSGRG